MSATSAGRLRRTPHSRGQAMVEFALVAPIFLLMLFFLIEAGRFILYYEMLNNATREGARYAIVHGSNSSCPSGPAPPGQTNPCDPTGTNVKRAVRDAAISLASTGQLFSYDPVWVPRGSSRPNPGDASSGIGLHEAEPAGGQSIAR